MAMIEKTKLNLSLDDSLGAIARRVIWWQSAEETLADTLRFVAQVMTIGSREEVEIVRQYYGEPIFEEVLKNPPVGVFDPKSWSYWHLVLGYKITPPLPVRSFS